MSLLTVAITGARGLIGRQLVEALARRGHRVRALVREPTRAEFSTRAIEVFRADLPEVIDPSALVRADVVVHAAYTTRPASRADAERVNLGGTRRLYDLAKSLGVPRFVFLSSLSASSETQSVYARTKHQLEQELDPTRAAIVRPGLVLAREGGLFQRMRGSLESTRFVPLFGGGEQIMQTIHIDDLIEGLARIVEQGFVGEWNLAEPEGLPFRILLERLARTMRRPIRFVSLPARPIAEGLRWLERAQIRLPIGSDNIAGQLAIRHHPTGPDLARLGLSVRSAEESLTDLFRS